MDKNVPVHSTKSSSFRSNFSNMNFLGLFWMSCELKKSFGNHKTSWKISKLSEKSIIDLNIWILFNHWATVFSTAVIFQVEKQFISKIEEVPLLNRYFPDPGLRERENALIVLSFVCVAKFSPSKIQGSGLSSRSQSEASYLCRNSPSKHQWSCALCNNPISAKGRGSIDFTRFSKFFSENSSLISSSKVSSGTFYL